MSAISLTRNTYLFSAICYDSERSKNNIGFIVIYYDNG